MSKSTTETFASIASDSGSKVATQVRSGMQAFVNRFRDNIAESGRNPATVLGGFALAWGLFFLILFVMPTPAGLSPAGKACLAVVVWACITWMRT